MSSQYANYGNVVKEEMISFPKEPQVDIEFVWNDERTSIFREDIRKFWDDPEDFTDLGGGTVILSYARVYLKGEEHLKTILKSIDKKKHRKGSTLAAFDMLWTKIKEAVSNDSSYFE